MTPGLKTVTIPVKDLATAKPLYDQIFGVAPYKDEAYYVGYIVDGQEVGLDPNGHSKGMTGPVAYWQVDDVNESLAALVKAGAEVEQPANDVGGGLIARIRDADGNVIGLFQPPADAPA